MRSYVAAQVWADTQHEDQRSAPARNARPVLHPQAEPVSALPSQGTAQLPLGLGSRAASPLLGARGFSLQSAQLGSLDAQTRGMATGKHARGSQLSFHSTYAA